VATRTIKSVVAFTSPFRLSCFDGEMPAGEYAIERDEELLEGTSHAYRRVATYIHLPAISAQSLVRQMAPVDPAELEAALLKDTQE
jgi:hypothetical protein